MKDAHRTFFGCEIEFDAPVDRVVLPREALDVEPLGANGALWSWLCSQAESELATLAPRPLAQRVREEIRRSLAREPAPSMRSVAGTLGVSERTLRRALAEGATTFRRLTDEARRDIARSLLGREGASITRVALEAGFADASAFTHACRRWFGRPPREIVDDLRRSSRENEGLANTPDARRDATGSPPLPRCIVRPSRAREALDRRARAGPARSGTSCVAALRATKGRSSRHVEAFDLDVRPRRSRRRGREHRLLELVGERRLDDGVVSRSRAAGHPSRERDCRGARRK